MSQAERMWSLFRGFAGAHGTYEREEFNAEKGKQEIKGSAKTLRRPVTEELWEAHLEGTYHLGIICITEENTANWGCVDIDDYTIDHATLVERLTSMDIPAVVCRTKSGGAHVFLFFTSPLPARVVQSRMTELAEAVGYSGVEVYPKQINIQSKEGQLGNWLNMPYFAGDQARNHAIRANGMGMSLEQFLKAAESSRLGHEELQALRFKKDTDRWSNAPPCLEHLATRPGGIQQGMQNTTLFSFAVLAKKMYPEGWESKLREWNTELCRPAYPENLMVMLIKSVGKNENYNYKCHDVPCVTHCNLKVCREREFGVGRAGGDDSLEKITVLDTEPRLFFVTTKVGNVVECDAEILNNPGRFSTAHMDQAGRYFPQFKRDTWGQLIDPLLQEAVHIEAPPEVGVTGQFTELLERFCTDRHAAENREELLAKKPWRDEDTGMVWFRLIDVREFMDRNKFSKLKTSQMTTRIRKMGGREHFFNIHGKGVNVWGVPIDQLQWTNGKIATPNMEESPL